MDSSDLLAAVRAEGFPYAGLVDLDLAAPALAEHVARYDHWLEAGRAGEMDYLKRGRDRRADPRLVFSATKSVLAAILPYGRAPAGAPTLEQGPRYARYLGARDYHKEVAERLERAMASVSAARFKRGEPALHWKVCVDTSAVLERTWAAFAGLGWIGKNTMLIHPKEGSYVFIGIVLLDQATGLGPAPIADYCGHCTKCLDACPTKAFPEPHALDSTRCISYWTLEKRGELSLAKQDHKAIGPWVAGCDICQEVCPFNLKPAREDREPAHAHLQDWAQLESETREQYEARVKDSALKRVKWEQFRRNVSIAKANAVDRDS